MSIIVRDNGGTFTPAPEGTHPARCIQIIELGTQTFDYQGERSRSFKLMLGFELPTEINPETNEPFLIYREYTASLSEKSHLRAQLKSWRGRDFTQEEIEGFVMDRLLGVPCLVTVNHKVSGKGRTYGVIAAIVNVPKGMSVPDAVNDPFQYEIGMGKRGTWDRVPEWIQQKIESAEEFVAAPVQSAPVEYAHAGADDDSDLPF